MSLRFLCCSLGLILSSAHFNSNGAPYIWSENFDDSLTLIGRLIINHELVELTTNTGVEGSNSVKVLYYGYDRGSKRVVINSGLGSIYKSVAFSFSVKFCEGFDFGKGGKLHGVGPKRPITGGKKVSQDGWSARLMFRTNGGLMTYVYHQKLTGKYGESKVAKDFRFVPDRFYRVDMRVTLNDPPTESNGFVVVSVDGQEVIKHGELKLRSVEGEDTLVQTLLFNTFHGGHSRDWAPRTGSGDFKVDCAFFDDFTVQR